MHSTCTEQSLWGYPEKKTGCLWDIRLRSETYLAFGNFWGSLLQTACFRIIFSSSSFLCSTVFYEITYENYKDHILSSELFIGKQYFGYLPYLLDLPLKMDSKMSWHRYGRNSGWLVGLYPKPCLFCKEK